MDEKRPGLNSTRGKNDKSRKLEPKEEKPKIKFLDRVKVKK